MSPFAPHLAEELWQTLLGKTGSVALAPWPTYDEALCIDDVVELPVQVNGKIRGKVTVGREAAEDIVRDAALGDENVQKFIAGKAVRKVVYVPGRILNFIVG